MGRRFKLPSHQFANILYVSLHRQIHVMNTRIKASSLRRGGCLFCRDGGVFAVIAIKAEKTLRFGFFNHPRRTRAGTPRLHDVMRTGMVPRSLFLRMAFVNTSLEQPALS